MPGLAATFTDAGHRLKVLVECDTGMGRCGVQTNAEALDLARQIDRASGLSFGGLMTYPAAGRAGEADRWLIEARDVLKAAGLDCDVISSGGTPDIWRAGDTKVVTEYRPGTYIYLDRYQVAKGVGGNDDCALTVLSTVVSHPTPTRAILDAGSKALSSDTLGLPDFGELIGVPGALVTGLSEEHGTVTLNGEAKLSDRPARACSARPCLRRFQPVRRGAPGFGRDRRRRPSRRRRAAASPDPFGMSRFQINRSKR